MSPGNKGHVAFLAFPFGSHAAALLSLAHKLAEWAPEVAFSFFTTSKSNGSLSSWPTISNIRLYDVADGLPEGHVSSRNVEDEIELFLRAAPGNFREALKRVDEKVSCVVSDAFLWFAGHVAEEMGVPWVSMWASSACSLTAHVNTDLIRQMIGTQPDVVSASLNKALDFIPGCSMFRVRDLPEGVVFGPLDSLFFKSLHRMGRELPRATAIVFNAIEEIESTPVLDHLRTLLNRCLPVGPLTLLSLTRPEAGSDPDSSLAWLESQAHAAVAYVCFGRVAAPPPSELAALAEGLEASGAHFLWSLKDKHRESLPAGFLDRTKKRGLVVPWAPQSRVLGHLAVGAFLSHGGWNSVLESITEGVPMMCRPFFGDHRIAAQFSSNLGIAIVVKGGVLTREAVIDGLDMLLNREEGKKMREKMGSIKLIAKDSVSETGSCTKNLKTVLEIIKGSAEPNPN
ncbi:hypothetical protein AAC387_Pa03g0194 [Persea americana]